MRLSFSSGPRAGDVVEVGGAEFTIGRDASCDLVVEDEKASRRHAVIQAAGDGAQLSDLGSSNGTFVNGERVVGAVTLQGGEMLRVGTTEFAVLAGEPAAAGGDTFVGEPVAAPEPTPAPAAAPPPPPPPPPAADWGAPAASSGAAAHGDDMSPFEWYVSVLKKYADFNGRARRREYWWFALFNVIVSAVLFALSLAVPILIIIYWIYGLAVLLPSLGVSVRRLHDLGRSGWWILIALIPIVGAIILLVWYASDSVPGENEYGPNPKGV